MTARATQIAEVAEQLARELGMSAVTVRAVAERAGVGVGTLRHHYPRQRDLHDAVVHRLLRAELEDADVDDTTRPLVDRLTDRVAQLIPPLGRDDAQVQLVAWFGLYTTAVGPDARPGAARFLALAETHTLLMMREWLGRAVAEGAIEADDVADAATLLLAVASGLCLALLTPESDLTVEQAHRLLRRSVALVLGTA